MELQHYFRILSHHKLLLVLEPILVVVAVVVGTTLATPVYSASTLLRVAQPTSDVVSSLDLNYTQRLVQTYVQVLKSRPFLEETSKRLGLDLQPSALAELIEVEAVAGTELIRIRGNSSDPQLAAAIANTLAELLIEQGQKVYTGEGKDAREILLDQLAAVEAQLADDRANLALVAISTPESAEASNLAAKIRAEEATYSTLLTQYERVRLEAVLRANSISVIEPAIAPTRPSKPNLRLNVALAAVVGLFGGLGLAFLFESLAPNVHSDNTFPAIGQLELVGKIPSWRRSGGLRLGGGGPPPVDLSPEAIEPFLALGAAIFARRSSSRTLVISSAEPSAGKSTIAAHLGVALAQMGRQVVVVDGDQRRPKQHVIFDLPLAPGLVDAVLDPRMLQKCLRVTRIPGLRVLTAGSQGADQLAFWHGAKLPQLMQQLLAEGDVVIWDTPPTLAAVDAKLLAPFADLLLLVVAEDRTTRKQLESAIEQLRQAGCGAPGIIYNKTKDRGYRSYHYYYRSHSEKGSGVIHGRVAEPQTASTVVEEI